MLSYELNENEVSERVKLTSLLQKYGEDGLFIYNQGLKDFADYLKYEWALDNLNSLGDIEKIRELLHLHETPAGNESVIANK